MNAANKNLALRIGTAVVLVPLLILGINWHRPEGVFALVFAATIASLIEYAQMMLEDAVDRAFTVLLGAAVAAGMYWWEPGFLVAWPVVTIVPAIFYLFRFQDLTKVLWRMSATSFGVLYAGVLFTFLSMLKRDGGQHGADWVYVVLTTAWFGDTAAYFFGRFLGKTKLYPAISPGKTWAGAFGGLLGAFGGAALANAIWAYIALPEPAHRHRSARGPLFASLGASLRLPGVGFWLVMLFVITYAFAHVEASLVLWTTDLMHFTPRDNGLVFTWIGVVLVLAQMGGTRRLAKVMPETTLATLGCAMMAIGTVLTPAFPHWGPLMALMGLMAFGNALTSPAVMSAISRAAPPEAQGEILGVSQSVSALGRIAGPPASGILYQHVGRWSPWVTCGALLAIAAAAISVFARGASPRSTPTGR